MTLQSFVASGRAFQRRTALILFVVVTLLMLPAAVEPFMLPKATALVLGGVVLTAAWAVRVSVARCVQLPVNPQLWGLAALVGALVATTVTSSSLPTSVVGFYGRYTGLATYLAHAAIFLAVLAVADRQFVRAFSRCALAVLAVVIGYGLLQSAGLDPVDFDDNGLGTTFSFFGNVNFSAAWAGAVAGVCLVVAGGAGESRAWRVVAALLLPLDLLYVMVTGTSQGLITYVVSVTAAGTLLATREGGRLQQAWQRRRWVVLVGAGLVLLLGTVLGYALRQPLRAQLDQALVERPDFWRAALAIFQADPMLGTGLDTYAHFFLAFRPASHALANGVATTDAPHSVPLGMLSNGGLLLGIAYAAFVLLVGFALVRGAIRLRGADRLALAVPAGIWAGYQAQSLVSFDVPPLALLHYVSAALIVALAAPPRWKVVRLPGWSEPSPPGRKRPRVAVEHPAPSSTRILTGCVVGLALVAAWVSLYPLRADLAAASAGPLTQNGRFDEAVERFDRAAGLNPAEASYAFLAAQGSAAAGRQQEALRASEQAARRDPGTVQYALFAARTARELGEPDVAERWYRDALRRDPLDPPVLNEAAAFFLSEGDAPYAAEIAGRSLALREDAEVRALLERASA